MRVGGVGWTKKVMMTCQQGGTVKDAMRVVSHRCSPSLTPTMRVAIATPPPLTFGGEPEYGVYHHVIAVSEGEDVRKVVGGHKRKAEALELKGRGGVRRESMW